MANQERLIVLNTESVPVLVSRMNVARIVYFVHRATNKGFTGFDLRKNPNLELIAKELSEMARVSFRCQFSEAYGLMNAGFQFNSEWNSWLRSVVVPVSFMHGILDKHVVVSTSFALARLLEYSNAAYFNYQLDDFRTHVSREELNYRYLAGEYDSLGRPVLKNEDAQTLLQ